MDFIATKLATGMAEFMMKQLLSYVMKEVTMIWNADKELDELVATYRKIGLILAKNPQVNNVPDFEIWLLDLEGYCYDTEDLFDDLHLSRPSKESFENHTRVQVPKKRSPKRVAIAHKIIKLQDGLNTVYQWIERVHSTSQNSLVQNHGEEPLGLLLDITPLLSGTSREGDKQAIIEKLTSLKERRCSGVSIVGIDGLGKTALARTILDDDAVKTEFPLIARVHVSGHFKLKDVAHKLGSSLQVDGLHQNDNALYCALQDVFRKQKTLIVLDDLCSVTNRDWEKFKSNCLNVSPGWKVLITTCNTHVAEVTESIPHYLDNMTNEDCNRLIIEKANLPKSDCVLWASDIEVIAKKCKGLPIIASEVGLILSKKRSVDEPRDTIRLFKNINNLLELSELEQVRSCLISNKREFAPDLKRCFSYCSLFSLNHRFIKDDLIQLWEVEGFVGNDSRSGSQCFADLLSRSLLQPLNSSNEIQPTFKMLAFNHEFAELIASQIFLRIDEGTEERPSTFKRIRHLSLLCQNVDISLLKQLMECEGLRTFLLLHRRVPIKRTITYSSFPRLESLRLLDLSHTDICKLTEPLNLLEHLRYLDLSESDIQSLPEPICSHFRALQVLKLKNCSKLDRLPHDLNQLISLRHLHVNMKLLTSLPSDLGALTNLEFLSSYMVGSNEGHKVTELRDMKNLREICISNLENIDSKYEAQESRLTAKQMLTRLELEWGSSTTERMNLVDVLEGLEPEKGLKDLVIRNYKCRHFPTWLVSPSRMLVSIYLENFHVCKGLPSLGQLPVLKTLALHSFDTLEIVDRRLFGQGEIGFPRLESLEIRHMRKLLFWIGLEVGDMPCLHSLKIIDCPMLACLPPLSHQARLISLEIIDCPTLKALPDLSPSLNGERVKVILRGSPLVEERCQVDGADWPKIKDKAIIQIFSMAPTSPKSSGAATEDDKVPREEQHPTSQRQHTTKTNPLERSRIWFSKCRCFGAKKES